MSGKHFFLIKLPRRKCNLITVISTRNPLVSSSAYNIKGMSSGFHLWFPFKFSIKSARFLFFKMEEKTVYRQPPKHSLVPGTNFTVDWHCKTDPKFVHSFLSHAHSDHLNGIGSFRSPRVLHCTPITAKLVLMKHPKLCDCICMHEIGSVFEVEGVKIHVLNANHTPGSVMFLFMLPTGKKILHTGDFCAEDFIVNSIKAFSPIDSLYIDCTYGTSKLNILPKETAINFVCEKITSDEKKRSLILIGTYTLGKEDLAINIAKALGTSVFVPDDRFPSIQILHEEHYLDLEMFVRDPYASRIHLMSIANLNAADASLYALRYGYDSVVCIRASGWGGRSYWQVPQVSNENGVEVIAYNLPYSEHSTPAQLVKFVGACKPARFTSITQFEKKEVQKLEKLFFKCIRKDQNKKFIEFYASPPRPTIPKIPDESQEYGISIM